VEEEAGRQKLQRNKGTCLAMEDMVVKYCVQWQSVQCKSLATQGKELNETHLVLTKPGRYNSTMPFTLIQTWM
jgi:hypothetical protein